MCVAALGRQERILGLLELMLQILVSGLMWVLETELQSSERTASVLKC